MKFEKVTPDARLWSAIYDNKDINALEELFNQWEDPVWLREFFKANMNDLSSYFKITDVNRAIYDTIEDNEQLQCLILDLSPEANLDELFRPLENNRLQEMILGKEKARLKNRPRHASWLRIYAIKLDPGIYIVTGGAIKLAATMGERQHTIDELRKMEDVRNHLIANGVIDADGFNELMNTSNL